MFLSALLFLKFSIRYASFLRPNSSFCQLCCLDGGEFYTGWQSLVFKPCSRRITLGKLEVTFQWDVLITVFTDTICRLLITGFLLWLCFSDKSDRYEYLMNTLMLYQRPSESGLNNVVVEHPLLKETHCRILLLLFFPSVIPLFGEEQSTQPIEENSTEVLLMWIKTVFEVPNHKVGTCPTAHDSSSVDCDKNVPVCLQVVKFIEHSTVLLSITLLDVRSEAELEGLCSSVSFVNTWYSAIPFGIPLREIIAEVNASKYFVLKNCIETELTNHDEAEALSVLSFLLNELSQCVPDASNTRSLGLLCEVTLSTLVSHIRKPLPSSVSSCMEGLASNSHFQELVFSSLLPSILLISGHRNSDFVLNLLRTATPHSRLVLLRNPCYFKGCHVFFQCAVFFWQFLAERLVPCPAVSHHITLTRPVAGTRYDSATTK
ncbi:uncharacterized protein DEA37_0001893 [Paragonimus westermani]|uniref:Uncharacterized protein n=1 Tax=Paragonimus westermani TaxID=34504 RepID=A0A5J4NIH1_9TREM|nr:uncharacterized protein DEA37_0001893 [Paragonimus westermani]